MRCLLLKCQFCTSTPNPDVPTDKLGAGNLVTWHLSGALCFIPVFAAQQSSVRRAKGITV